MPPRYERLEAWSAAHELVLAVYRESKGFPTTERFGLTSQLRRATVSIAANIAEGAAKRGDKQFRCFLDTALGSLGEVTYLLRVARDLELLTEDGWRHLETLRDKAGKLTWGLYKTVGR